MEKGNRRSPVNVVRMEQNNHTRIGNSSGDGLPPFFITPGGSQGDNNPWGHQNYRWYQHPRLDLPVFSGDKPQNWLRNCRKSDASHPGGRDGGFCGAVSRWKGRYVVPGCQDCLWSNLCLLVVIWVRRILVRQNHLLVPPGSLRGGSESPVGNKGKKGNDQSADKLVKDKESVFEAKNGNGLKMNGYKGPGNRYFKKMLPQEFQYRANNGLCYRCSECYKPGHVCKFGQVNVMLGEELAKANVSGNALWTIDGEMVELSKLSHGG
ncbi:OLC1v1024584C1 [Oldenlandia corymbosa var. corymbosa]|uniref:OLC1v1024584C1 n=1 Tax=Oldenlandia corymbosa var. corymbosa TaxID=529605 RepID=A0AAV1C3L1_OLDCO|nr:OLC1v1024584C1 [Oldenlandia corymbosa var. corymbosa]